MKKNQNSEHESAVAGLSKKHSDGDKLAASYSYLSLYIRDYLVAEMQNRVFRCAGTPLDGKCGLYNFLVTNNLVDYGNIVSARFHLPMGLYDVEKIKGAVVVDVGKEDENYRGISRSEIHANGKMILRDEQGIFGNPTADSLRTSITPKTTSALAVFFCPPEVCNEYIKQVLAALEKYYIPFTGKDSIEKDIIVL